MIVVDASVLGPALVDTGADGDTARARMTGEQLGAPQLIDLEITSILRRAVRARKLKQEQAQAALQDLDRLPLKRAPHQPLLGRIWELRDNLTPYDAAYVALAEALNAPLITADTRIPKAPGLRCPIELLKR